MAPEVCEALISFFVLNAVRINIDACHVPGLSLGCPEKGGTVPVSQLLSLPSAGLVIMQSSGFEGTESRIWLRWVTGQLLTSHLILSAPVFSCVKAG